MIDTGFPLDAVGLVNSMFMKGDNARRTPQEGRNALRGKVNDNVPEGGDSRRKGRDGLGTGPNKVPGAGANGGDSSGQAGCPSLTRGGRETLGEESIPALVGGGPTPWVVTRVLLHEGKRVGDRRRNGSEGRGGRLLVSRTCPPP